MTADVGLCGQTESRGSLLGMAPNRCSGLSSGMDTAVSTSPVPQPSHLHRFCCRGSPTTRQRKGRCNRISPQWVGDRQHPGRTVDPLPVTLTGATLPARPRFGDGWRRKLQRNSDLPDDFCQHPSTLQLILQALGGLPLFERGKLCSFGERVFLTMLVRG